MGRTINLLHVVIVRRVLVLVPNDKADRSPRRLPFINAGKELDFIILFPGSRDAGLPRLAPVQFPLYLLEVKFKPGRATVYHSSDSDTVGLAEGCQPEDVAKRVHQ